MSAVLDQRPQAAEVARLLPAEDSDFQRLLRRDHVRLLEDDNLDKVLRLAEVMASGKVTVPRHLQGNVGDCAAIITQSQQWGFNPWAVAQKTHLVHGVLGYEAQLVAAAINASGVTTSRFEFDWFGEWDRILGRFVTRQGNNGTYHAPGWSPEDEHGLGVLVWATLRGETKPRRLQLMLAQAAVRNSTLWASDPKQQIAYLVQKRWARLYTPDVMLGVYTPDELDARGITGQMDDSAAWASSMPQGEAPAPATEARDTYDEAQFAANLATSWRGVLESGRKTPDQLIAMVETKAPLTDEQKARLRACVVPTPAPAPETTPAGDQQQLATE